MTESFVAFVRHGEKVLLLRRSDSDVDYPLLWDGIYGIGTTAEEVVERVSAATGLEPDQLEIHGHGRDRGVEIGGRLQDITPWLVYATTDEVTAGAIYTDTEWVDPGKMQEYNLVFTDLQLEGSERILRDLYGSAGSFLYIVKTAISSEQRVAEEMHARLSGSGSLSDVQDEIFSVLHPNGMRGYLFVESSAQHHVEKLIGRSGGRDPAARRGLNQTPLKNAKTVLPGEAPLADILPYLEPKAVTSGIEVGCIVEIVTGAFKGEKARVLSVAESKEEVSMELYEQPIPMTLNMRGDHVRVVERVE